MFRQYSYHYFKDIDIVLIIVIERWIRTILYLFSRLCIITLINFEII